jgi:DNA-binding CsgD family transcriptional regulator
MYGQKEEGSRSGCACSEEISITDTGAKERDRSGGDQSAVGQSQRAKTGFVYFIQATSGEGLVKIGFTGHIDRRMRSFDLMLPFGFTLLGWFPGSTSSETWVHRRFEHIRAWGEWFHLTDELQHYIDVIGLIKPAPPKARRDCASLSDLTSRQREVVQLRSTGLTQEEISSRLGISQEAVRRLEGRAGAHHKKTL